MSAPAEETQLVDDVEETKPIDKWDGAAVKNRLDDAVKYFFTSDLKYSENFLLIDIRLAISSAAVGVAMYALVADYLSPFPGSRPILLACVLAYFAVMVILTLYTTLVEKGIFLKASKDNKKITVSSYMKRFDDEYQLILEHSVKGGSAKSMESFEHSVAKWFDEKGYFLEKRFEDDVRALLAKVSRKH